MFSTTGYQSRAENLSRVVKLGSVPETLILALLWHRDLGKHSEAFHLVLGAGIYLLGAGSVAEEVQPSRGLEPEVWG